MDRKEYKWLVVVLLVAVLLSYLITTVRATNEPNGYVVSEMTLYSGPSYNASSYATHTEVKDTLRWLERKGLIVSYYCPSMRQSRYYLSSQVKHLMNE